jgi:acyl carrier protein
MEPTAESTNRVEVVEVVRRMVQEHARLPVDVSALADQDDLFAAGMNSLASVSVMLGIENAFDVEFPDSMLKRSVFQSISALRTAVDQLLSEADR